MALSFEELKQLANNEHLKYFVDPVRPVLMAGFQGLFGSYQATISVQDGGVFLQFRTLHYFFCPANHTHLGAVLKILGEANYQRRMVKFGWDPADGEVMAYADVWLVEDGKLTQAQFRRMLESFVPTIDMVHPRLEEALRSGQDPGPMSPEAMASTAAGLLPGPIRELLEKLVKGLEPEKPEPITEI